MSNFKSKLPSQMVKRYPPLSKFNVPPSPSLRQLSRFDNGKCLQASIPYLKNISEIVVRYQRLCNILTICKQQLKFSVQFQTKVSFSEHY